MKTLRHPGFADFLADSKELEKQLLRDNAPAVRQSHTPRETLMGYRIGEEVFEDLGLEAETHPSDFIAVGDIADDDLLAAYRDSPEDAYNRMIDHFMLPMNEEDPVEPADDVEALVAKYQDRVEQDEAALAGPEPVVANDAAESIEHVLFAAYVVSLARAKSRRDDRRHVRGVRASHGRRL